MRQRWWKILLAGIALELLYVAFLFNVLGDPQQAYAVGGQIGVFFFMAVGGFLVARTSSGSAVINGILVGVAAHAFYVVVSLIRGNFDMAVVVSGPYALNVLLKIVGGAAGGVIAGSFVGNRRSVNV